MKKLFPFILTGTILASSCMICYGGTATLSKENKETSFDIYAIYEPGENDYFSAPVKKDGTCEIELPNGIRISVQDVTQENLTLIVYLIPVQDEDAWEWFTACLSGRGTRLLPFEIYFEDASPQTKSSSRSLCRRHTKPSQSLPWTTCRTQKKPRKLPYRIPSPTQPPSH